MPAVAAKILVIAATPLCEIQEVPGEQTNGRVFDLIPSRLGLQKGMATIAGVLVESVAGSHKMNLMPKQVALISDLLRERRVICVWISSRFEEQRVPALNANVLVVFRPHSNLLVAMTKHEAGNGMRNPRFFVCAEIVGAAAAMFCRAVHRLESDVADLMTEQQARQLSP